MTSTQHNKENVKWGILPISRDELNLRVTLKCGQSFRWKEIGADEWIGVIRDSIVTLTQTDDTVLHQFLPSKGADIEKLILEDYFQLKIILAPLYNEWGLPDHSLNKQFKSSGFGLKGVRLIRQDPLECLYSFICSSNNNIGRITKMVNSLCANYGTMIDEVNGDKYYSFPTIAQLSAATEDELREAGFGYRAKFIVHTTKQLQENPEGWLDSLRAASREDAQKHLTSLMGVGQKVADCVSLFSLDKLDIVPVDTHIWTVAQKHMTTLKGKSLTTKLYKDIGDFFRDRFGLLAGWAHTVLFAAELPAFQHMIKTTTTIKIKNEDSNSSSTQTTTTTTITTIKIKSEDNNDNSNKENDTPQIPLSKRRRTKKL